MQSRILLSVLSFRLNQRYVEGNPPFIAIDIDISDSAREGCVVSTLTITSEPKDWRGAVQVPLLFLIFKVSSPLLISILVHVHILLGGLICT